MSPRLAPLDGPFAPEIEQLFAGIMPPGMPALRLFRTLAHNPRVLQRFFAGGLLDRGSLTLRERELAILRTTARCGSEYEWGVHVAFFAARAGLGDAELRATCAPESGALPRRDALILALCDALHDAARVDAALWAELEREFQPAQLLELLVLCGFYHTVAFLTNALEIELEAGAARFPSESSPTGSPV